MIKKEFKQKYFLYCRDNINTENLIKRFGNLNNNSYIAPKIIKIEDV